MKNIVQQILAAKKTVLFANLEPPSVEPAHAGINAFAVVPPAKEKGSARIALNSFTIFETAIISLAGLWV